MGVSDEKAYDAQKLKPLVRKAKRKVKKAVRAYLTDLQGWKEEIGYGKRCGEFLFWIQEAVW
jgi:hypothetical protein